MWSWSTVAFSVRLATADRTTWQNVHKISTPVTQFNICTLYTLASTPHCDKCDVLLITLQCSIFNIAVSSTAVLSYGNYTCCHVQQSGVQRRSLSDSYVQWTDLRIIHIQHLHVHNTFSKQHASFNTWLCLAYQYRGDGCGCPQYSENTSSRWGAHSFKRAHSSCRET
jgi:hypothetical protein